MARDSSEIDYESLKRIIKTKDIERLKQIDVKVIDKYNTLFTNVINSNWNDGIKFYQKQYTCWSWSIKNCFTIFEDRCDPYKMYKQCPNRYKRDTIEHINSYGAIIKSPKMMAFPYKRLEIIYKIRLYLQDCVRRFNRYIGLSKNPYDKKFSLHILTCPSNT